MPERAKQLLSEVHDDAPKVIAAVNGLAESQRRTRWWVAGALVVTVAASALFIVLFVRQSNCVTDRTNALTGPGNLRVSYIIDAFRSSALAKNVMLTDQQRTRDVAELKRDRERYPVIPDDAKLAKLSDSRVLIYLDAIRAIDADDAYQAALDAHPVCSLWSL